MLQRKLLISSKATSDKFTKILLSVFLFLLILIILTLPFLIKVKVECKSQYGDCPSVVNSKLETLNSKNLFLAKIEIKKILKQEPSVTDYSIQFKLPPTLLIEVLVKKPIFAIQDTNHKIYLIDQDGKILYTVDSTSLPTIVQESSTPNLFALKLISGVFEMYQVRLGTIQDNGLVVDLSSQVKVIFPLEGDIEVLLGTLRLVYPKVGQYSQIDLRFKNPVLR